MDLAAIQSRQPLFPRASVYYLRILYVFGFFPGLNLLAASYDSIFLVAALNSYSWPRLPLAESGWLRNNYGWNPLLKLSKPQRELHTGWNICFFHALSFINRLHRIAYGDMTIVELEDFSDSTWWWGHVPTIPTCHRLSFIHHPSLPFWLSANSLLFDQGPNFHYSVGPKKA